MLLRFLGQIRRSGLSSAISATNKEVSADDINSREELTVASKSKPNLSAFWWISAAFWVSVMQL
jgi:hypothetical protein